LEGGGDKIQEWCISRTILTVALPGAQEGEEEVLKLVRDDPGLLWIILSACETALQQIDVA